MCLFSILCSAKQTHSKNNNNTNNQLPPCLPSQLLPESASALKTQLLSCRLLWRVFALACMQLRACVCQWRSAGAMQSIQQARTMHTQEVGTESKKGHTPHVTAPTTQPTLWCHFVNTPPPPPEHPTTSATAHRTASPPSGQSGN